MASYTISGPSSSVGNFPNPLETFKLIISLEYMVLGTAVPLALLQLENCTWDRVTGAVLGRGGGGQKSGTLGATWFILLLMLVVIMLDQETTDA